jgi:Domain of Unknown Function (DUF748)
VTSAAGEPPFDITLAAARLGFDDVKVAVKPEETSLAGTLDLALDRPSAVQAAPRSAGARAGDETRLTTEALRVALAPLNVTMRGDRLKFESEGSTRVEKLSMRLPRNGDKPASEMSLGALRANIEQVSAESSSEGMAWQVRLDAIADAIGIETEKGKLASLKVRSISIGDAQANDRQQASIERIVIEQPQAFFTRQYLTGTAKAEESRPKQIAEATEQAAQKGWDVRLGSFSFSGGSTIRVRDTTVDPNTNLTIDIKDLQVSDLNTGDPAQRTNLRLDATLNQFTNLLVSGWAAPFGKQADFDLNARLQRLELPPLSPYAAQAIGVNVESGRLSVDATAAADAGALKGDIGITLRDLEFSTLSAADAERLSASVGVPIETVVGLLQDDDGRIRLNLPVSGDLQNPSFDLTDAISQALSGALQAAVLAPFKLAFAPVSLIAGAVGGGGGITFEPVPFEPGTADLTSTGKDMAAGLGRVLQERDKLKLRVCGRATAEDLAAEAGGKIPPSGPERDQILDELRPKLEALASERTAKLRSQLIDVGGAKPRQVGECRSAFDPADTGQPRALVQL